MEPSFTKSPKLDSTSSIRQTMAARRRDRLSELPESLILEILSLLPMEDVVRTTILSKRWKDLWTSVPCLHFCDTNEEFVEGALAKRKDVKIRKFLVTYFDRTAGDILDSWLLVPIEKQVEELHVTLGAKDLDYCPLQRLYTCSSITKLSLSSCALKIEDNVNVQLNRLKCLLIEHPLELGDDAMKRILSGAPLLEELVLFSLDIDENLNIESTSLKTLVIGRTDGNFWRTVVMQNATLSICAPNLLNLKISGCVYGSCLLDVPSLNNAVVWLRESCEYVPSRTDYEFYPPYEMFDQLFRSLRHVEKLILSDLSVEFLIDMMEHDMVAQFPNAKFLKLYAGKAEGLLDVFGMFPKLMMLVVEHTLCYELDTERCVAAIDACNSLASEMTFPNPFLLQLKTIDITWSIGDASTLLPMVQILLGNARVLEKLVLRLRDVGGDMETFTLAENKLLSMPRSSSTAQVIISVDNGELSTSGARYYSMYSTDREFRWCVDL